MLRTLTAKEIEVRRKDGHWYNMRILPYLTVQNAIGGLVISFLDINKFKMAEESMKVAQQWQETFDAIPDMVSIHDRDYNIIKVNEAFARAFGMTREELVGKKCYEVFHQDNAPVLGCPHGQTLLTEQIKQEEIFEPTRNAYFDISTVPVFNDRGEITHSVHIARDVTQRKRSEVELAHLASFPELNPNPILELDKSGNLLYQNPAAKRLFSDFSTRGENHPLRADWEVQVNRLQSENISALNREVEVDGSWYLETIVLEPSSEHYRLYGRDISERKKGEQIKDEFIGLISHELRTPLTIITGSLHSAMSQGVSPEDVHELLENAAEGADSLADILENMLELSRHQAGRLQLHMEPVDIADSAQRVIDKLKRQGAGQKFLIDLPGDLPMFEADPMRVDRVLYNLLENAVKYSPVDSEIRVTGQIEGDFIITSITDQGRGISPENKPKLFEPFQQLEVPSKATSGVGLGLVVCKRLVEAQGGWIKVDSEVGRGSTFSFGLPVGSKG